MKLRVLALVCLSCFTFTVMAEEALIVRFNMTPSIKRLLREKEFDVTGVNYNTNEIEALLTPAELAEIQETKTYIHFSFPQTLAVAPDQEYKNPQEIEDFIKDIHGRFPDITEVKSIGKSLEGRDIWAIKISSKQETFESKPVILINAMHHAREVMTPEITTDMIEYLTVNYNQKSEVTKWVDETEIWVVPMFNVDGNAKMWSKDSMWRKNTRDGHGVDINRNYPTAWNSCRGSSGSASAQDFRGTGPASEPETQSMMALVASIKPVFNISYHSYSEIVIYPFGCSPKRTPTAEAVETIGAEIGKKLNYRPGTSWELLYNVDGGDIDWMYTEHQVIPYVIEVNSTLQGFHPSYAKWRDVTVLKNRVGWMHLLDRLQGPGLHGQVDVEEYSAIKIMKAGDPKVLQTYKINPNGSYFIVLRPGSYDFSFEGQKSRSFKNVSITSKTVLEF